jgi:hypothetical protein
MLSWNIPFDFLQGTQTSALRGANTRQALAHFKLSPVVVHRFLAAAKQREREERVFCGCCSAEIAFSVSKLVTSAKPQNPIALLCLIPKGWCLEMLSAELHPLPTAALLTF